MKNTNFQFNKIEKILVLTDFSQSANNALEYAVPFALKLGASIQVLHIYQIPMITVRGIPITPNATDIDNELRKVEQLLDELKLKIPRLNNVEYTTKAVPGYWSMEFPEIVNSESADIVLMGMNGHSGFKEKFIGSNTFRLLDSTVRPVLAIPYSAHYADIERIGFAYDFEAPIVKAMEVLSAYSRLLETELKIFYVKNGQPQHSGYDLEDSILKSTDPNINQTFDIIYDDSIELGINDFVKDQNIDILGIMPRKHNFFYRLFNNSLAKRMIFYSTVPLLVIPE